LETATKTVFTLTQRQHEVNRSECALKGVTIMPFTRSVSKLCGGLLLCAVFLLLAGSTFAGPSQGTKLGPEDPDKQITMTVWLNLHNRDGLDALVQQMYDKESANFHQFLTMAQFADRFAPTPKEVGMVRDFLAAHNLEVTSTDKYNLFVTARGRVADAQAAFNTQINRMMVRGKVHRINASEPKVHGAAASLISTVQGLSDFEYRSHVSAATNPETGKPYAGLPLSGAGADGVFFSSQCLRSPEVVTFTTGGSTPSATYIGNRYGQNINSPQPNLPPCGYDAANLQQAYGLDHLYNKHLDGTGQTVMIVDAFGSNTIVNDANLFSTFNKLPSLTSSNFAIFTPIGPATCASKNGCISGNWQFETTLDVEWAHAIAPGANIALILAPDSSFTNLDLANLFAIENGFGNVLSNSFGIPEIALVEFLPSELTVQNGISEIAAALGISQQVSTGDSGDNLAVDNADFGINSVSAGANADSPFVTAIGGTSTFLDSKNNIRLQTGWGFNEARIAEAAPNPPTIPPLFFGFLEGAGGGASVVYPKPKFQKGVPGHFRQTPDISMNADPETGVEIIVTPDSVPGHNVSVGVFGGTSLSAPMFTAFWAIANQAAGGGPVGEAAPILYELRDAAIADVNVTPRDTRFNVTGVIVNPPSPPTIEREADLAHPGDEGCTTTLVGSDEVPITCPSAKTTKFYLSALFQSPTSTRWDVFTFGTDSSLATGPGWDNVTGLGTPNGVSFIDAVLEELNHH
jgi:subtilase family serine protease